MICPNCGSDDWRLLNYNSYTDTFTYECSYCGNVYGTNNGTINTNKSIAIEGNKQFGINTNSSYTVPYDSNMCVGKNLAPNEVTIEAEKITIADKTIGIQIDISKQILDNTDSIVINGVKYVKERTK